MKVTLTVQHQWVKWSLTVVDVIVDPFTGDCLVFESPDEGVGEQVCCQVCSEPLTNSSVDTPCRGDTEVALP